MAPAWHRAEVSMQLPPELPFLSRPRAVSWEGLQWEV